ncbi:MAG: hypothetical protein U1F53_20730 [Burkholderiaceae bacterium]
MTIDVLAAQDDAATIYFEVHTANFGMLGNYLDIPPGRIHAEAPGLLLRVPQPRSSVLAPQADESVMQGLDVVTGAPAAYVAFRQGSLFIAIAFNPLEPQTRAAMHQLRALPDLPIAIEFVSDRPSAKQYHAMFALGCDAFSMALDATEGMSPVDDATWLSGLSRRLVNALPSLGLKREELSTLHVHCCAALRAGPWPVVREEPARPD